MSNPRRRPGYGDGASADRAARLGSSLSGTNLVRAGDYNQRVVLQAIMRHPGITRSEIATKSGLTPQTIANIAGRLFEADLIVEDGRREGGRGQPAVRLKINPDGGTALGLNIDRDHITLVVLDLAGEVRWRVTRDHSFPMPDDVRAFVADELGAIRAGGLLREDRVLGVGIALPDGLGDIALPHRPPGYEAWRTTDPAELLRDLVPWSIHCDNDAAAAAIGEAQFGGHDHATFFYILLSAGLGGGLVIEGAYYRGATSRGGEIGLLPLDGAGGDGRLLQDVVSLSSLAERLEAVGVSAGPRDHASGMPAGSEAVVDAWIEEAAAALVQPLASVNCLINPGAILIGARLPDTVIDRLAACAAAKLAEVSANLPAYAPIGRATLSRDAAAVGAAILAFLDQVLPSDSILMK